MVLVNSFLTICSDSRILWYKGTTTVPQWQIGIIIIRQHDAINILMAINPMKTKIRIMGLKIIC
jgi:hypothetical protein